MLSLEFHFQQRCTGIAKTDVACPVYSKCMTSSSKCVHCTGCVCVRCWDIKRSQLQKKKVSCGVCK